jgi:serine/threonine-protein kinase RsbW
MEAAFAKATDSLPAIFDFVEKFTKENCLGEELTLMLQFVIEEMFINMVRYNSESKNDVTIQFRVEGNELLVTLIDHDVHYFDPRDRPPVDVTRPVEERMPGGLGIHLTRQMMDDIRYEYVDRTSKITLVKRLGSPKSC